MSRIKTFTISLLIVLAALVIGARNRIKHQLEQSPTQTITVLVFFAILLLCILVHVLGYSEALFTLFNLHL